MLYHKKVVFLVLTDFSLFWISLLAADALKYDRLSLPFFSGTEVLLFTLLGCGTIAVNAVFGCYQCSWKYAGVTEALRQGSAALIQLVLFLCAAGMDSLLIRPKGRAMAESAAVTGALILFILMCSVRFSYRFLVLIHSKLSSFRNRKTGRRILVCGNIPDSKAVMEKLYTDHNRSGKVVCILSTEKSKDTSDFLYGIRVLNPGGRKLNDYIRKYKADTVILSKNDMRKDELLRMVKCCTANRCVLKVYSGIENYKNEIRNIDVNDLLGRSPTAAGKQQIYYYMKGKTILVSGGAGSIGSEICRQALEYGCSRLIIFDISENGLFELDYELKARFPREKYVTLVGSVRDEQRLDELFRIYRPDIVFHAAAHKHVPMMELNPGEAVKNNVIGTYNMARKAIEYGAGSFILISTDKAVNPANIMGMTKRAAEMTVQSLNAGSAVTKLAAVRFGNVLDSNGSVVPIFRKQILSGGPVTITHPDMERYFMTIAEAVQLVLQAGAMAAGGEIYVLDMGKPVKIVDLANAMIRLYGLEPGIDIEIQFTGQRPGEKFTEELVFVGETCLRTKCKSVYVCKSDSSDDRFLTKYREMLEKLDQNPDYRSLLGELIGRSETPGSSRPS